MEGSIKFTVISLLIFLELLMVDSIEKSTAIVALEADTDVLILKLDFIKFFAVEINQTSLGIPPYIIKSAF